MPLDAPLCSPPRQPQPLNSRRSRSGPVAVRVTHNQASRLPAGPILIARCAGVVPRENAPATTPQPARLTAAGQHTRPPRVRCPAHRAARRWRDHGSPRSPRRRTPPGSRSRSSSQHSHQHMTLRSRICDSISPISSRSVHLHRVARTSSLSIGAVQPGPSRARLYLRCWLAWSSSGSLWEPPTGEPRGGRTKCGLRSRASTTDT